ncbi:MAG: hypothetical protein JWP03_4017 [Phycisphaerales bacterium]|jgi:hypothetical protein|nr:hypothetical protein [Phycisphaerales bacterium]
MLIAKVKPVAGADAATGMMDTSPSMGRLDQHVLRVLAVPFVWLYKRLPMFKPTAPSTPWEVRMAEKARHKEIRRELRGLPPIT